MDNFIKNTVFEYTPTRNVNITKISSENLTKINFLRVKITLLKTVAYKSFPLVNIYKII